VTTKTDAFRALHEGDPFIIPNPWDAGSAKVLAALGFKALATTSSGFAFTLGRRDGGVSLDEALANARLIDAATDLPVSVDMEDGYGPSPAEAARAVRAAREAGVAGGSIEDWDRAGRIFERAAAVERVAAAADAAGGELVLTARAENLLHGVTDLDDTIARLQAYGEAGADVLYAPGLRDAEQVRAVCSSLDKPVNVLGHRGLSFAEIAEAGGQRVSVGGALTWAAAKAFVDAARKLSDGDFSALTGSGEIAGWLDPS
jgi:2-methylisocitrate lyase-like PEP mutase family enzyme